VVAAISLVAAPIALWLLERRREADVRVEAESVVLESS
jgi:hypothetical protein